MITGSQYALEMTRNRTKIRQPSLMRTLSQLHTPPGETFAERALQVVKGCASMLISFQFTRRPLMLANERGTAKHSTSAGCTWTTARGKGREGETKREETRSPGQASRLHASTCNPCGCCPRSQPHSFSLSSFSFLAFVCTGHISPQPPPSSYVQLLVSSADYTDLCMRLTGVCAAIVRSASDRLLLLRYLFRYPRSSFRFGFRCLLPRLDAVACCR